MHSDKSSLEHSLDAPHDGPLEKAGNRMIGETVPAPPGVNANKVIRKMDLRIVPILCLLYLLAFLDRVNISNARLFKLEADLHMVGNQFNTSLAIFFVPYILFEIPSNVMLKKFRPHRWLSICMFTFGLVTTLQGLVKNYSGLLATRFFLGLAEAAMFPGCFYLLSMWYTRYEAQKRFSFFFCSTSLAGAFGGLIATGIGHMKTNNGWNPWRWVFIIEGLITVVVSVLAYFLITDFPEDAKWLTPAEKEFVIHRLSADVGHHHGERGYTVRDILRPFRDPKIWLGAFMYFGLIVPAYSFAYFAPSIAKGYGKDANITQLLTVPPWIVTFIWSMINATLSDAMRVRFPFTFLNSLLAIAGFAVLRFVPANESVDAAYAGLFLGIMGVYGSMPTVVCWFNMNLSGHLRRAVGTGWQIGFGNIGAIIAIFAFLPRENPSYHTGKDVAMGFCGLSIVACSIYLLLIWQDNKAKEEGRHKSQRVVAGDLSSEERRNKEIDGDTMDPEYRYMY